MHGQCHGNRVDASTSQELHQNMVPEPNVTGSAGIAAGSRMNSSNPFGFERLLTVDDWILLDPFPHVHAGSQERHEENAASSHVVNAFPALPGAISSGAAIPDISHDVGAAEFLHWLMNTSLVPELPDLPVEDDMMMMMDSVGLDHLDLHGWIEGLRQGHDGFEDNNMDMSVDYITYEQLRALGEQIGGVCTGLGIESISANLSRRIYNSSSDENEHCVICQEEFMDGEDIAKPRCVHEFHFDCIKQWLITKNLCPLCKRVALVV